ncbi:aquaporin-10-like isoform X1 [Asterias rubens]|uniref:aquaporin-10-like isoform X1 n=1 Tax=Asterias rubens TaxID=7604 RepID=UPI0014559F0A|nr:aquaporin-10-like isoform X1 [Asterias rubens]
MMGCVSITKRCLTIQSDLVRGMLAELAGTFILVLFVDGGLAQAFVSGWTSGTPVSTALTSGMGVAFGIYTGVGVSGGHVNPSITIGLASVGKFPWKRAPLWIAAQLVGAFSAAFVVYGIYYPGIDNLDGGNRTMFGSTGTAGIFSTYPQQYFGLWVGLAEQIINTGLLLHCTLVFFDEKNGKPPKGMEPFFVGLSVSMILLTWGHNAGAPMNPARDFAGRLLTWVVGYGNQVWTPRGLHWWWIPTFVPLLGGICGAHFYVLFVERHHPKDTHGGYYRDRPSMDEFAEMQPGNAQQTMNCLKHPSPTYDYESHHVTGDENN